MNQSEALGRNKRQIGGRMAIRSLPLTCGVHGRQPRPGGLWIERQRHLETRRAGVRSNACRSSHAMIRTFHGTAYNYRPCPPSRQPICSATTTQQRLEPTSRSWTRAGQQVCSLLTVNLLRGGVRRAASSCAGTCGKAGSSCQHTRAPPIGAVMQKEASKVAAGA